MAGSSEVYYFPQKVKGTRVTNFTVTAAYTDQNNGTHKIHALSFTTMEQDGTTVRRVVCDTVLLARVCEVMMIPMTVGTAAAVANDKVKAKK
jgi:hypothetical protein